MNAWGLVLAGGGGNRFGGLKQFAELGGRTLLDRVVEMAAERCDGVVVVLPAGHDRQWPDLPVVRTAVGGSVRAESVRNGLSALPAEAEIVVITDAAHPLASGDLYEQVIAAVRAGADGALPGLPLTDAIKRLEPAVGAEDGILGLAGVTTPAGGSVSAQMPMAFRRSVLLRAHETISDAVEDSAMVTAAGGRVVVVPGEPTNVHVTTPAELVIAEALLPLCVGVSAN